MPDENMRLFKDRLAKAKSLIEETDRFSERCPEAFSVWIRATGGLGGDLEAFESLFRKAAALEPGYSPIHTMRAWYLQPQWYGSDEQVIRAAEEAAEATKA